MNGSGIRWSPTGSACPWLPGRRSAAMKCTGIPGTIPRRNNYIKKFNTSIRFWHETGGGLDEETIRELTEHGYHIQRNGVSNYTLNKKSRIIFLDNIPDQTDDIKSTKDIPSWKRMCFCILKNDHICRFMGFGLTRQQQKRIEAIRKKYKSIEEFDYGI